MTQREHNAERRGYWQGAAMIMVLWVINDAFHPAWWLAFLIAIVVGICGGLIAVWLRERTIDSMGRRTQP